MGHHRDRRGDTIDVGALDPVYPPVGSCLLWVPGTSVGLHYRSGGTSYRIAAGSDVAIGAQIVCEPYGATVSIEATIGYARPDLSRPIHRADPAHDLPRRGARPVGAHRHGLV
jgi:hypothetical protein